MTTRSPAWKILGPLSGMFAVVLGLIASTFTGATGESLDPSSPAAEIAREFVSRSESVRIGSYLGLISSFLLFWFLGYLRRHLQDAEGDDGWLTFVAYGGGLVVAAVAAVRASFDLASTVLSAGDGEAAKMLIILMWNYDFVFAAPMAALVGAATIVGFRFKAFPTWLNVLGVPVVLLLLSPAAPGAGALAGFLWTVPVSMVLLWVVIKAERSRSAAAQR